MSNKFQEKLIHLHFFDIIILSLIFFGHAIISSTQQYFSLQAAGISEPTNLEFSADSNYWGILIEIASLFIAWLYLRFRHFHFSQLNFSITRFTSLKVLTFIFLASFCASIYDCLQYYFSNDPVTLQNNETITNYSIENFKNEVLVHFSFSFFLFACLNGFFEEIFFTGLVFCVSKKHLPYAIIFSLIIRFSFHTYQGIAAAMTITILGIVFALLRLRNRELVPFFIAHSFFDLFGLTFLLNILYLTIY